MSGKFCPRRVGESAWFFQTAWYHASLSIIQTLRLWLRTIIQFIIPFANKLLYYLQYWVNRLIIDSIFMCIILLLWDKRGSVANFCKRNYQFNVKLCIIKKSRLSHSWISKRTNQGRHEAWGVNTVPALFFNSQALG